MLSPDLFYLYGQRVKEELGIEGISIKGRNVTNIRYADDIRFLADSEEKLQVMVTKMEESCEGKGLKINVEKTKAIVKTKK